MASLLSGADKHTLRRKRLRQANATLISRVGDIVASQTKDAGRLLAQSHAGLCTATESCQDVCRNIQVSNEELTELSVELMNAAKRLPPFFARAAARGGRAVEEQSPEAGSLFDRWEVAAGGPGAGFYQHKEGLFAKYLAMAKKDILPVSDQILRDVPRTPGLDKGAAGRLTDVLHAYSLHDPQCKYVQGMNTIGAFLLMRSLGAAGVAPDKAKGDAGAAAAAERAFWMLSQVMTAPQYSMRSFFVQGMPQLHVACFQLSHLLRTRLARVSTHFDRTGIAVSDFFSTWMLTLYTAAGLPVPLLDAVFGRFLIEGYPSLLAVALGALTCCEQALLVLGHDECIGFLKKDIWKAVPGADALFAASARPHKLESKELHRMQVEFEIKQAEKRKL